MHDVDFGSVWFSLIRFGLAFIYLFITLADDCQRAAAISLKLLGDVLIIVLYFYPFCYSIIVFVAFCSSIYASDLIMQINSSDSFFLFLNFLWGYHFERHFSASFVIFGLGSDLIYIFEVDHRAFKSIALWIDLCERQSQTQSVSRIMTIIKGISRGERHCLNVYNFPIEFSYYNCQINVNVSYKSSDYLG